jgi:hypothetical protein
MRILVYSHVPGIPPMVLLEDIGAPIQAPPAVGSSIELTTTVSGAPKVTQIVTYIVRGIKHKYTNGCQMQTDVFVDEMPTTFLRS